MFWGAQDTRVVLNSCQELVRGRGWKRGQGMGETLGLSVKLKNIFNDLIVELHVKLKEDREGRGREREGGEGGRERYYNSPSVSY